MTVMDDGRYRRSAVKNLKAGPCWYCGAKVGRTGLFNYLTWDHVLPLSKGGINLAANLVLACLLCNHEKGNMTLEKYRRKCAWERAAVMGTGYNAGYKFAGERTAYAGRPGS